MASPAAILYLHGLASSPKGRKRELLEKRFAKEGLTVAAPDLNVPSFRKLNFFEMVAVARTACERSRPRVVVGSSLGALVALSLAESSSPSSFSSSLVLIAPALGFHERWKDKLPDGEEFDFFHHGEERPLPIHRRFFEEMADVRVDEAPPHVAVSIVMGTNDESVTFAQVAETWKRWEASGRLVSGSRFHRVEGGDHGLVEFGDWIEAAVRERLMG